MKKKTFIGLATLSILSAVGLTQFSPSVDAATIEDVKIEIDKIKKELGAPKHNDPGLSKAIYDKIAEIGEYDLLNSIEIGEISADEVLAELKVYRENKQEKPTLAIANTKLSDEELSKLKGAMEYEEVARAETAYYKVLDKNKDKFYGEANKNGERSKISNLIAYIGYGEELKLEAKIALKKSQLLKQQYEEAALEAQEFIKSHPTLTDEEKAAVNKKAEDINEKRKGINVQFLFDRVYYVGNGIKESLRVYENENPEFKEAAERLRTAITKLESKVDKVARKKVVLEEISDIEEAIRDLNPERKAIGLHAKLLELKAELAYLENRPFSTNGVEAAVSDFHDYHGNHGYIGLNGAEAAINEVPEFDLSTLKPEEKPAEPSQEKPNVTPAISEVKPELKPEVSAIVEKEETPKKWETVNSWKQDNGKWYRYDKEGKKQTGWVQDGNWYYLNSNGEMKTGWLLKDNTWYYLNNSGAMEKGWNAVDGKWYFMNQSGAMEKGWVEVSGQWYFMNSSGVMQTGWVQVSGKWYYFNQSGELLTNTKTPDGYYVNANGEWV